MAQAAMVKQARALIAESDAQLAMSGDIPQVVYIFRAKNYHGLKDQVETVATIRPVVENVDGEQIRQKYLDDMEL